MSHELKLRDGGISAFCPTCGFLGVSDEPRDLIFFEKLHILYPHRFFLLHTHNLQISSDHLRAACCCGFRAQVSQPCIKDYFELLHQKNKPHELKSVLKAEGLLI